MICGRREGAIGPFVPNRVHEIVGGAVRSRKISTRARALLKKFKSDSTAPMIIL